MREHNLLLIDKIPDEFRIADTALEYEVNDISNFRGNSFRIMHINHYTLKSEEDFKNKQKRHQTKLGMTAGYNIELFNKFNLDSTENCGYLEMPPIRNATTTRNMTN